MVGRDWGDGSLGKVFSVQALGPEFKSLTFTQLKKKRKKGGTWWCAYNYRARKARQGYPCALASLQMG